MKQAGVNKITVSSVEMARQHADWGWKDIAIPINIRRIREIEALSMDINLNVDESRDPVHVLGRQNIHHVWTLNWIQDLAEPESLDPNG